MIVYEHIILTKRRINQKKWDIAQREYSTDLISLDETPKQKLYVYKYLNADSIEQVKEFNRLHECIVMTPLGQNLQVKTLDMITLLKDSENAHLCSVTGKKVLIVHCV